MSQDTSIGAAGTILCVDDQPANLQLLASLLAQSGHVIRVANSGAVALESAGIKPPELILLDVRMPEMDGYEVCAQLKRDERLRDIPVIFVSAHGETQEKVKGFQAGGVDYVTKPFQAEEILARVETHISLHRMQAQIRQYNARLEQAVRDRTRQLAESNVRLSLLDQAKSDFLTVISHELNTPLNGLLGVAELALAEISGQPQWAEYQQMFAASRRRIMKLVEDALLLSQVQVGDLPWADSEVDADEIVAAACCRAGSLAQERGVAIAPPPAGLGHLHTDPDLLAKALFCLIETGIQFSRPGGLVQLAASAQAEGIGLTIRAAGHCVPADGLDSFFEVMAIGKTLTASGDLGLSPAVAAHIIRRLGGRVTIKNLEPAGVELEIWLASRRVPAQAGSGRPPQPAITFCA